MKQSSIVQFCISAPTALGTPVSCTVGHPYNGKPVQIKILSVQPEWDTSLVAYTGLPVRIDFDSSHFQAHQPCTIIPGQGVVSAAGGLIISGSVDSRYTKWMSFAAPKLRGVLLGSYLTMRLCDASLPPGSTVGAMASSAIITFILTAEISVIE